ncbi:hypothetical protein [Spiroplasma endosymbiont of Crioceris asparagi]|uniref:hypothetical protein n=1 Tax=Spiroplasma endosymbiont of Crioceris asparagi TaxID=3066286 RepID=UPI0030D1DA16
MNKKIKIVLSILLILSIGSGFTYFAYRFIYVNYFSNKMNYNHKTEPNSDSDPDPKPNPKPKPNPDPKPNPKPKPNPDPKPNPQPDKINLENIILVKEIGYQDDLTNLELIKAVREKNINLNINWVKIESLKDSQFFIVPTTNGQYYSKHEIKITFINGMKVPDFGKEDTNIKFTMTEKSEMLRRVEGNWNINIEEFQFIFFKKFLNLLPTKSNQGLEFSYDDNFNTRIACATYEGKTKKFIWTYKI